MDFISGLVSGRTRGEDVHNRQEGASHPFILKLAHNRKLKFIINFYPTNLCKMFNFCSVHILVYTKDFETTLSEGKNKIFSLLNYYDIKMTDRMVA